MKKSKENILITRSLSDESPLWQLSDDGHKVIAQSFLEIIPTEVITIPRADVYFYYSKNAAKCFWKAAEAVNFDLTGKQHAAMGNGTASILKSREVTPNFIGLGSPEEIAKSFLEKYRGLSICFVRAEQSTQSIQKLWPTKYQEVVAYSIESRSVKIEDKIDTIFATSPMNLRTALQSCNTENLQRIICIGKTTYDQAVSESSKTAILSAESSEQGMLEAYYNRDNK